MKTPNPYLNFPGNTEEAFTFYKSVFGGEFVAVVRYQDLQGDGGMGAPAEDQGKIAHIALPIGDGVLMATDALESFGRGLTVGNNFYINLEAESGEEADRLFAALSAGGRVEMPLQRTQWAEKYGACADKFGVQWMVNYRGEVSFGGGQEG